jgi:glycosyltransferase involved in cell wall biosynthesis
MLSRRTLRRATYSGLGVILLAGLATLSWLVIDLTLILALLALGWEVRGLRLRAAGAETRVATLGERLAETRRVQSALAAEVYDQGVQLGRDYPAALMPWVLRPLIGRGDVLDAYRLAARHDFADATPGGLRRLRDNLQRRGYYDHALTVAGRVLDNADDRRVQAMLRGEIAVTSGTYVPAVEPWPPGEPPVEGRVLHLVGKSLPQTQAGYTLRTHYIVTAQRAAGLDPHVVTQTGFGAGPLEVVDGIPYHRLPGADVKTTPADTWLAAHVTNVAALVRELRPAVLHAASDFLNALTASAIGTAYEIPVVYESRGFWEETYLSRQQQRYGWDLAGHAERYGLPDFYLRRRAIEDEVRRRADRVVTLAAVMADRIVEGGVARERVELVPNAVDADAFPVVTRDPDLAARHGIGPDTVVIGYISSLAEYEGVDTLIAAYAQLIGSGPVALLVVGDGMVREDLERQAAALGLTGVYFTGQVPHDEILRYYGLIDIFVVPRRPAEVCHLVTPLKPFEAFATGRTVVLSDVRALAAIAADSQAAELFPAGDADALAVVLRRLLADPERRRSLAAAGAAWVRAERTWAANARTYRRIYAELTAAGVPRQITGSGADSVAAPASGRTSP